MKKPINYLLIFILLISFLLSGCINTSDNEKHNYNIKTSEFSFEMWVNITENSEYEILIPLPLYDNGSISTEILDNLIFITGSGTFSVFNSLKGKCLKLRSNGSVYLKSNGSGGKPFHYYKFSLRNESTSSMWGESIYWINFNSSATINNSIITISCFSSSNADGKGDIRKTEINGNIIVNGWNEINGFDEIREI